jgi:hypothetical protein
MVGDPTLRRAIRLIAGAVHDFVKEKGWGPNQYRLFYRADESWGHIHIVFVAPQFDGGDYSANYKDLSASLRIKLQDVPGLFESIGIVLMGEKQHDSGGVYELGPEYSDVADEFKDYWAFTASPR